MRLFGRCACLAWLLAVALCAHPFAARAAEPVTICFSPPAPGSCDPTATIVHAVDGARRTIRIQMYAFTARPIMRALLRASRRGVDVRVIVDRSQFDEDRYRDGRRRPPCRRRDFGPGRYRAGPDARQGHDRRRAGGADRKFQLHVVGRAQERRESAGAAQRTAGGRVSAQLGGCRAPLAAARGAGGNRATGRREEHAGRARAGARQPAQPYLRMAGLSLLRPDRAGQPGEVPLRAGGQRGRVPGGRNCP